jgi:hypothetical protein
MARMSWLAPLTSCPQVTPNSETVLPSVMRRFVASIEGQLRATVPLVGITASMRVDGEKLVVEVEVKLGVDVGVNVNVDVEPAVAAAAAVAPVAVAVVAVTVTV